jgi:ABC-2 type transport system ATP-binding protein
MMYQSQLIAVASPDTLKNDLPGVLVQVSCDNPLLGEQIADGVPGVMDAALHGVQLHISTRDEKVFPSLKKAFTQAGIHIENYEFIQPSLEDVFITMVEERLKSQDSTPSSQGE